MNFASLQTAAQARHLTILGGFHPDTDDTLPDGTGTILMLGPDEPAFWPAFKHSSEWCDRAPDPMDRWSARVIGDWAKDLGATALFPFGGPPYQPFYSWALRTRRIHISPVQFLVHDQAGLFVSFRGALALRDTVSLPPPPANPCDSCTSRPCVSACPIGALTPAGYDVPACKAYLETAEGAESLNTGCGVRRACPVSDRFGRLPEQSAYHMRQFKGA